MAEESRIERIVSAYAIKLGCYARKFSSPAQRGVPDRIFISPGGLLFFIEFKSPGKKMSALQEREKRLIEKCSALHFVVDNVTTGKQIIDDAVRRSPKRTK